MPSDKSLQTYFFLWYHIIFCTLQNMAGTWVISTIGLKNKYSMLIWGVLWRTPLTSYHTLAYIASIEILAHCIRMLCSSVFYHRHLAELLCLMGEEEKKKKKGNLWKLWSCLPLPRFAEAYGNIHWLHWNWMSLWLCPEGAVVRFLFTLQIRE